MVVRRAVGIFGLVVLAVLLAAAMVPDGADAAADGNFYLEGETPQTPYATYAEAVSHTTDVLTVITLDTGTGAKTLTGADLDAASLPSPRSLTLKVTGNLSIEGFDASRHIAVLSSVVMNDAPGSLSLNGTAAAGRLNITAGSQTPVTLGMDANVKAIASTVPGTGLHIAAVTGTSPVLALTYVDGIDVVLDDVMSISSITYAAGTYGLKGAVPGQEAILAGDLTVGRAGGAFTTDLCFVSGPTDKHALTVTDLAQIQLKGDFSDLSITGNCKVVSSSPVNLDSFTLQDKGTEADFSGCDIRDFGAVSNYGCIITKIFPHTSYYYPPENYTNTALIIKAQQRMPDGTTVPIDLVSVNKDPRNERYFALTTAGSSDRIVLTKPSNIPADQYFSSVKVNGAFHHVTEDPAQPDAPYMDVLKILNVENEESIAPIVLESVVGSDRKLTIVPLQHGTLTPASGMPSANPDGTYTIRDGSTMVFDYAPDSGYEMRSVTANGVSLDKHGMWDAWRSYAISVDNILSDTTLNVEFAPVKEHGFAGDNLFYIADPFNGYDTFGEAVNSEEYDYIRPGYGTTSRLAGNITYTGPDPGVVDRNQQNGLPVVLHIYGGATVTGYDNLELSLIIYSGKVVFDSDSQVTKLHMAAGTEIDFRQLPRESSGHHFGPFELLEMGPGTVRVSGIQTETVSPQLIVPEGIVLDIRNGGSDVPIMAFTDLVNNGVIQTCAVAVDGSSFNYSGTGKLEYYFTFDNLGTPMEMHADVLAADLQNLVANANKANISNNPAADRVLLTGYTDAPGRTLAGVSIAGAPVAGFGTDGTDYYVGTGPYDITKKTVMTAVVDGIKVTVNSGAGGTLSVPKDNSVRSGSDFTFTMTPDAGYVIADLRVDGVRLDPAEIGDVRTNRSFTLTSVVRDTVIDLVFSQPSADGYVLSDRFYVGANTDYPYDTYAEAIKAMGRESSVTFYSAAGTQDPTVLDRAGLDLAVSSLASPKSISLIVNGHLKIEGFDNSVHSAVIAGISVRESGSLALVGDPAASGRVGISLDSGSSLDLGAPADITVGYGFDVTSATVFNTSAVRGDLNIAFTNINGGRILIGGGDMSLSGVSTPTNEFQYTVESTGEQGVSSVLKVVRPDLTITWNADMSISGVNLQGLPGSGIVLVNNTDTSKTATLTGEYDSVRLAAGAPPTAASCDYMISDLGIPLRIGTAEVEAGCILNLAAAPAFTDLTNNGTVNCSSIDFVRYTGGTSALLSYNATQATPDGSYYDITFEITERSLTSTSVLLSSPGSPGRIYLTGFYTPPQGQYISAVTYAGSTYVTDEDPAVGIYIPAMTADLRSEMELVSVLGSDRTITFTSSQGGSFAVPGPITVRDRHAFAFETVPVPGYGLSAVKADGTALTAEQMAAIWSTGSGTLTAMADMAVSAEFVQIHGTSADNLYYGLDPNTGYPTFAEAVRASPTDMITYTGPQPGSFVMEDLQRRELVLVIHGGMSVTGAVRSMPSMSFDVRSGAFSIEGTDYSIRDLIAADGSSLVLNGVVSVSAFSFAGNVSASASSPVNLRGALDVPAGAVLDLTNGDNAGNVFAPYDVNNAGTIRARSFGYSGTYSGTGDFIYVFGLKNGQSVTDVEANASSADMAAASGSMFKVPLSNNPSSDRLYLTGYSDAPKTRLIGASIAGQSVQGLTADGTSYYIGTGPYDVSVRNVIETDVVNTFLVTVNTGAGGSASCPVSNEVIEGDGFRFTFIPDNGFQLLGFSVDGTRLGHAQFADAKSTGGFDLGVIQADRTVDLEFARPTADGYILSDSYYLGPDKEYPYGTYADAVRELGQETTVTFYSDGTAQSVTVLGGTDLDDAAAAVTGSPGIVLTVDGQLKIEGFIHSAHSRVLSGIHAAAGSSVAVVSGASDPGRLGISLDAGSVLDLGAPADITVGYDRNAAAASVCNTSSVRGDMNITFTNINGSRICIGDGDMSLSGLTTPSNGFQYSVESDRSLGPGAYAVLKVTVPDLRMVWDADTSISGVILEGQPGSGIILQNNTRDTKYATLTGEFASVSAVRGTAPEDSNYLISHIELPLSIARFDVASGCRADLEDGIRFTDIVNLGTISCESIDFATYSGGSASPVTSVLEYDAMQATPDGSYWTLTFRISEASLTSTSVLLSSAGSPGRIYLDENYVPPSGQYVSALVSGGKYYVTDPDPNGGTYIASVEHDLRTVLEFESVLGSDRTITLESSQGGSFEPQGPITVRDRHDFNVSFRPVPGYGLASLKVDGTPVPQQDMEAVWRSVSAGFTADRDMTVTAEFADIHGLHQDGRFYSIIPDTGFATLAEAVRASEYNVITYTGTRPGSFATEDLQRQGLTLLVYGGMSVTGGAQGTEMFFDIRSGTFSYGSETSVAGIRLAHDVRAEFDGRASVRSIEAADPGTAVIVSSSPVSVGRLTVGQGTELDLRNAGSDRPVLDVVDVSNSGRVSAAAFSFTGEYGASGTVLYRVTFDMDGSAYDADIELTAQQMTEAKTSGFSVILSNGAQDRLYIPGYTEVPGTHLTGVTLNGQQVPGFGSDASGFYVGGGPYTMSGRNVFVGVVETNQNVTVICGEGGTVSPSGSIEVPYGTDLTITITEEEGYRVRTVTVNGTALDHSEMAPVWNDLRLTVTIDSAAEIEFSFGRVEPSGYAEDGKLYGDDPFVPYDSIQDMIAGGVSSITYVGTEPFTVDQESYQAIMASVTDITLKGDMVFRGANGESSAELVCIGHSVEFVSSDVRMASITLTDGAGVSMSSDSAVSFIRTEVRGTDTGFSGYVSDQNSFGELVVSGDAVTVYITGGFTFSSLSDLSDYSKLTFSSYKNRPASGNIGALQGTTAQVVYRPDGQVSMLGGETEGELVFDDSIELFLDAEQKEVHMHRVTAKLTGQAGRLVISEDTVLLNGTDLDLNGDLIVEKAAVLTVGSYSRASSASVRVLRMFNTGSVVLWGTMFFTEYSTVSPLDPSEVPDPDGFSVILDADRTPLTLFAQPGPDSTDVTLATQEGGDRLYLDVTVPSGKVIGSAAVADGVYQAHRDGDRYYCDPVAYDLSVLSGMKLEIRESVHTVTVSVDGDGTVTESPDAVDDNGTVTVRLSDDTRGSLKAVYVNGVIQPSDAFEQAKDTGYFVMHGVIRDSDISFTFSQYVTVTFESDRNTVRFTQESIRVREGTEISVSGDTIVGHVINDVKVNGESVPFPVTDNRSHVEIVLVADRNIEVMAVTAPISNVYILPYSYDIELTAGSGMEFGVVAWNYNSDGAIRVKMYDSQLISEANQEVGYSLLTPETLWGAPFGDDKNPDNVQFMIRLDATRYSAGGDAKLMLYFVVAEDPALAGALDNRVLTQAVMLNIHIVPTMSMVDDHGRFFGAVDNPADGAIGSPVLTMIVSAAGYLALMGAVIKWGIPRLYGYLGRKGLDYYKKAYAKKVVKLMLLAFTVYGVSECIFIVTESFRVMDYTRMASHALYVIIVAWILMLTLAEIKRDVYGKGLPDGTHAPLLLGAARLAVVVGCIYCVCLCFETDMIYVLTTLGVAATALTMGLRIILTQVLDGLIMMSTRVFKAGDLIRMNGGTQVYKILKVGFVSTKMQGWGTTEVYIIPNEQLECSQMVNMTYGSDDYCAVIELDVDRDSDVGKVKRLISDELMANRHVTAGRTMPAPIIRLDDIRLNSLHIRIEVYVDSAEDHPVIAGQLREAIYDSFNRNGINMPFPRLHLAVDGQGESP